jgi:hypothetical protein
LVPNRKDDLSPLDFASGEPIQFSLRPFLCEERVAENHDPEPRISDSPIKGTSQAVTYI